MTPDQIVALVGFSLVAAVGIFMALSQRARGKGRLRGNGPTHAAATHATQRSRARRR